MEKYDYIETTVVSSVPVTEYLYCDNCKKLIYKIDLKKKNKFCNKKTEWYSVTTGHDDWGNDSIESIDHHIYCPVCLPVAFLAYAEHSQGQNTKYFDIQHHYRMVEEI